MKSDQMTRRRFLAGAGTAALLGIAGCTSDSSDGSDPENVTTDLTNSSDTTGTGTSTVSGTSEPNSTEEAAADATATQTEQSAHTPHDKGSVHYHGYLTFDVNGERVDYDETRFYETNTGDPNFHFHERSENENLTHVHAKDVTVHYALNSLPGVSIGRTSTIELAGKTYSTADAGTSLSITVNNDPIDPRTYVLGEKDHIEVLVETSGDGTSTASNGTAAPNTTSSQ